jgi:hypothetical protein
MPGAASAGKRELAITIRARITHEERAETGTLSKNLPEVPANQPRIMLIVFTTNKHVPGKRRAVFTLTERASTSQNIEFLT